VDVNALKCKNCRHTLLKHERRTELIAGAAWDHTECTVKTGTKYGCECTRAELDQTGQDVFALDLALTVRRIMRDKLGPAGIRDNVPIMEKILHKIGEY
jgi:hypothetical protein